MKIKYTVIAAILFCAFLGKAQLPGYIGRRLEVGLDFMLSPHFSEGRGFLNSPINVKFNGYINYSYSCSQTIGFDYSYLMSTRRNNNKIGNFKEQIHLASIRRLKYKKSDLSAPIGFYRGFEVGLGFLVTTDVKGTTSYNNGGGYLAAGTKLITVRPLFDLVYGRRMGLGKRFTFNTSINVGVSGLIGSIIEALTSPNGAESKSDAERNIRRESALNFYKKHMLQLNFGFSFLIN